MRSQIMTGVMTLILGFAVGWLFFADMPWAAADANAAGSGPARERIGQDFRTGTGMQKPANRRGMRGQGHAGHGHGTSGRGQGGHGGRGHGGRSHGGQGGRDTARQALDVERTISALSRALSLTREEQADFRKVLTERDAGIKKYQTRLGVALNSLDRLQTDDRDYRRDRERLRAEALAALDRLMTILLDSRQAIMVGLDDERIRQMKLIRRSGRVGPHLSHWP